VIAIVALALNFGAGIGMVSPRLYTYDMLGHEKENGDVRTGGQQMGFFFLTLCGTLAFMMLGNLLPNLVVLRLPLKLYLLVLGSIFVCSLLGVMLSLFLLIEPQKTYWSSVGGGQILPFMLTVGCFSIFGFGFATILSLGIMIAAVPRTAKAAGRVWERVLPTCIAKNYRVVGIVSLFAFLCVTVSNFVPSPFGKCHSII
jgi:hypothetical protein